MLYIYVIYIYMLYIYDIYIYDIYMIYIYIYPPKKDAGKCFQDGSWVMVPTNRFQVSSFSASFLGGCCTIIDIPELHVDIHILIIQVYYNRLLIYG